MNKIYIFFGLVLLVSCAPSDIPPEKLEERQGVYYEVNSQIPYSGPIERYYENRQWKVMGNYKDGKREGLWEEYHDNGKLKETGNYKDGKRNGLWEGYNENGKNLENGQVSYVSYKGNYKDGKREDGLWEYYSENGQLIYRECFQMSVKVDMSYCEN